MPSAVCPFCAYDLSGECGRWQDRCPLDCTCPECGQKSGWSDAFAAAHSSIYDHARSGLRIALAWKVLLWTLWPPLFWGKPGMDAPVRARRLALWFILVPLGMFALAWVLNAAHWFVLTQSWGHAYWPKEFRFAAERIFHPFFDAGEQLRTGEVAARPFPNRRMAAVQAGWCAGAAFCLGLAAAVPVLRPRAIRAAVYGSLPLTAHLALVGVWDLVFLLRDSGLVSISIGSARAPVAIVLAVWLFLWWYCALATSSLGAGRRLGVGAATFAAVAGGVLFIHSRRTWMFV